MGKGYYRAPSAQTTAPAITTLDPRFRGDDEAVSDRFDPPGLAPGQLRHLRMPRSALVSASMNAGRENSRSAYFISGAACFGNWMP
jgi:hypothetical protein